MAISFCGCDFSGFFSAQKNDFAQEGLCEALGFGDLNFCGDFFAFEVLQLS